MGRDEKEKGSNQNQALKMKQHTPLTFSYLLYEVVNDETENGHEDAQNQDEKPVNHVWKDLGGRVVPCP